MAPDLPGIWNLESGTARLASVASGGLSTGQTDARPPLPRRRAFAIFQPARAGIAQLVERQLPKLDVAGSNPVARSNISFHLTYLETFSDFTWASFGLSDPVLGVHRVVRSGLLRPRHMNVKSHREVAVVDLLLVRSWRWLDESADGFRAQGRTNRVDEPVVAPT